MRTKVLILMHFRRPSEPFQMPEEPLADDIRRWLALDPDAPVSLWTMQQPGAVTELYDIGELRGNSKYAFEALPTSCAKKPSYYFAMHQARKRMPHDWSELPIWASFYKIDESRHENDTSLNIIVPKSRVFPSIYELWTDLLKVFSTIGDGDWPTRWFPTNPYINPFQDRAASGSRASLGYKNAVTPMLPHPPEIECRKSWETPFDIDLTLNPLYKISRNLQAMLPYIRVSDVENASEILQSDLYRWSIS